jgi:hypothetical protein
MNSDSRSIIQKIFQKYNEERVKDAFSLLTKLFNNILTKPSEDKFRLFKKSNETLKSKVLLLKETLDLLKAIGYVDLDEEMLAFQGNEFSNLKEAVNILNEYIEIINKQTEEKKYLEEQKKQEDQLRYQRDIDEKYRQEKMKQKKIKDQLDADKKEREKMEKAHDSVGKDLQYGAKVCKFEPKKNNERG